MDIVNDFRLIRNKIVSNRYDYVETYFAEYFGYIDERDVLVPIYEYHVGGIPDDYYLMFKYLELIKDIPCVHSWFPKIYELFNFKINSGRTHSHPKSLLHVNLWSHIGMYITPACRARFVDKHSNELTFLRKVIARGDSLLPYIYSFKNIIDYVNYSLEVPSISAYEFILGESSIMRYALDDVAILVPSYIEYVKLYDYKRVFVKKLDVKYSQVTIPKGFMYTFVRREN